MKRTPALLLLLALVLMAAGCAAQPTAAVSPASPAPTEEAAAPEEPEATPTPTPVPTPVPTPEPTPIPTPTPVPTAEPTPTPGPMDAEAVEAMLQENGTLCAVAYLGRTDKTLPVGAPSLLAVGGYNWKYPFLGSLLSGDMVECGGDEVFVLIPRSDVTMTVCRYTMLIKDGYTVFLEGIGEGLRTTQDGHPLIVRCNVADTTPNAAVVLRCAGEEVTCVLRATLGSNELMRTSDRITDITIYDFQQDSDG